MAENKNSKKMLGERLIELGHITKEQLWEAMRVQSKTGEILGKVLIKLGMVSDEVINEILGIPVVSVSTDIDVELIKYVPEQLIRKYRVIPVRRHGNKITVAMSDPSNIVAIDDLRLILGCEIEPIMAGEGEIEDLIQKYFGFPKIDKAFEEFDMQVGPADEAEALTLEEESVVDEAPIVRLVNSILVQSIAMGASDIHIEPQEAGVKVRFRVDGMLREIMELPKKVRGAMISRIKIMADMDIAEKRIPQDGRIQVKTTGKEIDMRISSLPTMYGEKIVMRLLDKSGMKGFKVEQLGFNPTNFKRFNNMLKNSYGIILITGPTGSGKTTTLYAGLNELNTIEKNIITVEDPVEYVLSGINQTMVNVKAGMTFAAGLRSILRQDPDIIMVGEIRDGETAEIAVKAAITGHLVLSTLHTNDAASSISRLVDMGIEPFLAASSILGVVAQRLLRRVCPDCREPYLLPLGKTPEREFMGMGPQDQVTLYRGKGCDKCSGTGYRGRLPIHELLIVTSGLRATINRNESSDILKRHAVEEGMMTLKSDGLYKASQGHTTIQEVMRVAYTGD
ncbi:MAG: type II secretion system protein E [Peptococcaceae bacterium BRH_c4a]|nr:MAG: type II secretion system protein E [Peptococcaceae bacterium BRH_c4a]